jgi:hypothetical protein
VLRGYPTVRWRAWVESSEVKTRLLNCRLENVVVDNHFSLNVHRQRDDWEKEEKNKGLTQSFAIDRRSRCGLVRGWPLPSLHFSLGAAPQVGQRSRPTVNGSRTPPLAVVTLPSAANPPTAAARKRLCSLRPSQGKFLVFMVKSSLYRFWQTFRLDVKGGQSGGVVHQSWVAHTIDELSANAGINRRD